MSSSITVYPPPCLPACFPACHLTVHAWLSLYLLVCFPVHIYQLVYQSIYRSHCSPCVCLSVCFPVCLVFASSTVVICLVCLSCPFLFSNKAFFSCLPHWSYINTLQLQRSLVRKIQYIKNLRVHKEFKAASNQYFFYFKGILCSICQLLFQTHCLKLASPPQLNGQDREREQCWSSEVESEWREGAVRAKKKQ